MKHGANIYKYAKKIGCNPNEIIDFSSNINLHQPKNTFYFSDATITKYADASYNALKKVIAKKYGLKKSQISLHNGASAAIFELFNTLKPKKVTLYAPLYGEYEKALLKKVKIHKINRFENLYEKPAKNSIVVFVNPSTPDGRYYHLTKLFKLWKKQNCTVILDESFLEFEALPSFRTRINNYKKLYIIHSFSKFYASAGVRIGAIFSHKNNIKTIQKPLWNISSMDVAFLKKRLQDKKFMQHSLKRHKKQKKALRTLLKNSRMFKRIYKSNSNFFLAKYPHNNKIFFNYLLKNRILTRTCGSFDFLDNKHFRFAIKDKKAHSRLKKVLKDFYE